MNIRKVLVVFKTHLDVGYTDLSSVILRKYVEEYIPRAMEVAEQINGDGEKKFIWTVGSFLIDYFYRHASKDMADKLDDAIRKGNIRWHGLSTTTHTELMTPELLEFSLSLSEKLDARFGTKTIGAKMTDVPGHTKGLVPFLASHGIRYLHIGTNMAAPCPKVPPVFRWQADGEEILVHYSPDYGAPLIIDGFDTAIEYAYTGDNTGPQSVEQLESVLSDLSRRYPGAVIKAATINDVASCLLERWDTFPVVTQEIGDTWIHGVGTDPKKVRMYYDLLRLNEKWLAEGAITKEDPRWHDFMLDLLLIPEHTWSVDIKKYLMDFTNWDKASFQAARKADKTDISLVPDQYLSLRKVIEAEAAVFRNGCTEGSYGLYEAAQAEQVEYLYNAVRALPDALRSEAEAVMASAVPKRADDEGETVYPNRNIRCGGYTVRIGSDGAIRYLEKGGKVFVSKGSIASLTYQVFSAKTVIGLQYDHNTHLDRNLAWTEADYHKAGLCRVPDLKDTTYAFAVCGIRKNGDRITVKLVGNEDACTRYGCPREAELIYTFSDTLRITLNWFDKDASRIPEALYLGFRFDVDTPSLWQMRKLNTWISPLEVVKDGNRKQHAVTQWRYDGADGRIALRSLHAPLCSVGGRNLYEYDNRFNDLDGGLYYCLFNNRWGTNYKTWCEDDVSLNFEILL